MKTADKQKMCSNCHGRIPIDSETCLYCGQEQADQIAETSAQTTLFEQQSLQDSLTSLYSPPYASRRPGSPFSDQQAEETKKAYLVQPPTREIPELKRAFVAKEEPIVPLEEEGKEQATSQTKGSIVSLLLMILGGNIFTLGLMQLFFSEGSTLRLEWQAGYWHLYCLAAVPLLFVGYRLASKLKS